MVFTLENLNAKISKLCEITRKMLDYAEICRKLQNVRKCAENNKLCGNVRRTVNCAIPHLSHLIGASVSDYGENLAIIINECTGNFLIF